MSQKCYRWLESEGTFCWTVKSKKLKGTDDRSSQYCSIIDYKRTTGIFFIITALFGAIMLNNVTFKTF